MKKLLPLILALATACSEPQLVNEGPIAYGANGLSAPAVYAVAPQPPRSLGSPAISMAEAPVNARPVLPPLDTMPGQNPQFPERGGREPLTFGVNPDLVAERPFTVGGLDPRQPMPIEQQVYAGAYAEPGEDEPYNHQDGDVITLTVKNQPEFNGSAVIERDGRVRIPGTEDYVAARGKNAAQIADGIARALRPYVRQYPAVRVQTASGSGGYYYVLGGVKHQGRFPLGMKPLSLSEAVFRANAELLDDRSPDAVANAPIRDDYTLADNTALERVLLITPHRTAPRAKIYNVASALYGGVNGQNPLVKNGQIVVVGESDNLRLEDYIRQALARDNQHAPLLKTYDPHSPILDSPLLNDYRR